MNRASVNPGLQGWPSSFPDKKLRLRELIMEEAAGVPTLDDPTPLPVSQGSSWSCQDKGGLQRDCRALDLICPRTPLWGWQCYPQFRPRKQNFREVLWYCKVLRQQMVELRLKSGLPTTSALMFSLLPTSGAQRMPVHTPSFSTSPCWFNSLPRNFSRCCLSQRKSESPLPSNR